MFYSQFILAKKGPLGTIWIAAHLERKLRKNQVADTDIGVSVDSIIFPEVPIALRLSSHLLLGVVRIYSKKVNYLFDDCSEALLKVKQAFRSAAVDLPPEESKAPYHSITLPETFDLDDFELPDTDVINGSYVDHHVSAKEQITLQDPMEGVVFSTSQFGLDERFGDGDASQIGLDLDEELLLAKGAPSGRGEDIMDTLPFVDSSVEPSSLFKGARSDEEIYDPSVTTETNFFGIQAPSTPGLVEGPNLPIAEDAQVSDDHMEEDRNSTEIAAKESLGAASSKPKSYSMDDASALSSLKEHDHLDAEKATSLEFPPLADEVMDFAAPGRTQYPLANEISLSNGSEERGKLQIQGPYDGEPTALSGFEFEEIHEGGGMQVERSTFPDNHSPIPEDADAALKAPASCPFYSESNIISDSNKESAKSGVLDMVEGDRNVEDNSCPRGNAESEDCQEHHESADGGPLSASKPLLQGCSTHLNDAEVSSDLMRNPACFSSTGADHHNFDGQAVSTTTRDSLLETENGVPLTDLPSPERLLSMPDGDILNPSLVASTPAIEILPEGDGDSTANMLIGRKRSIADSTITFQSITSVESFAAAQSKESLELVPNDDDLLSSILVGRRSTLFKVKPTPPIQDAESTKRRRVTPRSTPYKRKVLMDDSMVLHGDTIRQQLTNTEDIRRLRKKAPCTRSEIWVLQKQLLEDEIFSKPLCSGMSAELVSLHSQPFDLSGVEIVRDELSTAHHTETNEKESCLRPGDEETVMDINNLNSVDRDVIDGQGPEYLEENLNQQCVKDSSGHQASQQDASGENLAIKNEGSCIPAGDKADHSAILEYLPSPSSKLLEESILTDIAVDTSASLTELKDAEASVYNDVEIPAQTDENCEMLHSTDPDMASQTTNIISATDVSRIGSNVGEGNDNNLADHSNKGDLGPRTDEEWVMEQMEGFDSFAATMGINLDQSSRLDFASVFAAMSPQIRALAAIDNAFVEKPADQCESTGRNEIVGSEQQNDKALDHCDTGSRLDSSTSAADLELGNSEADKEKTELLDVDDQPYVDPTIASNQSIVGCHAMQEYETENFKHDTDFLNYDDEDDEIADDGDNFVPNADDTGMPETVGWSARTRAVANYLQVLFHKEAQLGRRAVLLDNLLAGKSRKEASRMFFETLVLNTRDYIHVEQEASFSNISIKPRYQLMKSEF